MLLLISIKLYSYLKKRFSILISLLLVVTITAYTSRVVCSMIFGGVLESLPDLRVCFCHARGSFLPTVGHVEQGFNCRPDLVAIHNNIKPCSYIGNFWMDCINHDPLMLEYVLKRQGSKRVTLDSDYPSRWAI